MSNPNSLEWLHIQDIQIPDRKLKEQFDSYMSRGEYAEGLSLLRNNGQQLKGKAFVADTITKIITGLLYLEREYNTGVTLFLSQLAYQYFELIDQFKYMRDWNKNTKFDKYNFVLYNEEVYLALSDVPKGIVPEDEGYWLKLGLFGRKGTPGTNVNVKYAWESNRNYAVSDLVSYNGNLYVALKENKGVDPELNESTWLPFLIVSKGKINVGMTPPSDPLQNTIWFKTSIDPLTATAPFSGEMFRYTLTGEWEHMYPITLFTLISDRMNYAPYAVEKRITITPDRWGYFRGQYIATYKDNNVLSNSLVEISYASIMTTEEFKIYSKLKVEPVAGSIRFSIDARPNQSISLLVKIQ